MDPHHKKFIVKVPASVSNIGPGFDVLGFAVKKYLKITASLGTGKVIFKNRAKRIPIDKNAVRQGFKYAVSKFKNNEPESELDMIIDSEIPLKSGLGSSAAARAGGIYIANRIFRLNMTKRNIARMTADLEGHADNAVPAVNGGFTVSYFKDKKLFYHKYNLPKKELKIIIGSPEIEVSTDEARKIIPKNLSIENSIFNLSRVSLLMGSFLTGDYKELRNAMEDKIHQPYRKKYIPGFDRIVRETLNVGSYGTAITGSGPSVVSFTGSKNTARKIGKVMQNIWKDKGVSCEVLYTKIDTCGIRLQERE